MTHLSEKAEGFTMFRVSTDVKYNLSVIPAFCGQLRSSTTLFATQCHLHRVSAGVEEDCMDRGSLSAPLYVRNWNMSCWLSLPHNAETYIYFCAVILSAVYKKRCTAHITSYFSSHIVMCTYVGVQNLHAWSQTRSIDDRITPFPIHFRNGLDTIYLPSPRCSNLNQFLPTIFNGK